MAYKPRELLKLNPEQEVAIITFWNSRPERPPSLKEITDHIFVGQDLDGRSKEGMAIKDFLGSRQIIPKTLTTYESKTASIEITDEQKAFISNNPEMTGIQITKILFKNPTLDKSTAEYKAVKAYKNQLVGRYNKVKETGEYEPPDNLDETLVRINKYVVKPLDTEKLTPKDKTDIQATMSYLNNVLFINTMSQFDNGDHRRILESQFIQFIYDKADITPEELTLYINLALDSVQVNQIQEQINYYSELQRNCAENSEGRQMSMTLADNLHHLRTEYHQNKIRQQKSIEALQGKRAERLDGQLKSAGSLLNLVRMWQDENERRKIIALALQEEELLRSEGKRLASVDEIRAKILGISIDDLFEFNDEE